jgi:hypothetical protein
VTLAVAAGLATSASAKKHGMLIGVADDAYILGNPTKSFPILKTLRVQVVRIAMPWNQIAPKRPTKPTDPADPVYQWSRFDDVVQTAAKYKIRILFTIGGTPGWANGHKPANRIPKRLRDLQFFSQAAATRYSGTYKPTKDAKTPLPSVRLWLAWNEPNNPVFLYPQWKRYGKRWRVQSAIDYAKICTAIYNGIHGTHLGGEIVACGGTDPYGNNAPRSRRPSVAPLTFLKELKKAGLRRFDVYAHHPYAGNPHDTPKTRPKAKTSVTLGNIGDLLKLLSHLYGPKHLWITEYGYQTYPPDRFFGVSWKKQAKYLTQAFAVARANPRIDMMLWFLIKDEKRVSGWQSGFFTYSGRKKPSFDAFRRLPH